VALYGDVYTLIQIKLDGDQAVATKLIGDSYIRSGEVTWKANVKTGVGQIQFATGSDNQGRAWEPQTLKIINPDRLTLTDTSCSCPPQVFRRVD
jgi:hypothetical protein